METGIHKTAIIDPKASIDEGVQIGPFCIVGEAQIEERDQVNIKCNNRRQYRDWRKLHNISFCRHRASRRRTLNTKMKKQA